MTLVMLSVLPLMAAIGVTFTAMFTKTQARGESAYATASGLVQEALSSIRTVFAFSAEARMQKRYQQVRACALQRCMGRLAADEHCSDERVGEHA